MDLLFFQLCCKAEKISEITAPYKPTFQYFSSCGHSSGKTEVARGMLDMLVRKYRGCVPNELTALSRAIFANMDTSTTSQNKIYKALQNTPIEYGDMLLTRFHNKIIQCDGVSIQLEVKQIDMDAVVKNEANLDSKWKYILYFPFDPATPDKYKYFAFFPKVIKLENISFAFCQKSGEQMECINLGRQGNMFYKITAKTTLDVPQTDLSMTLFSDGSQSLTKTGLLLISRSSQF